MRGGEALPAEEAEPKEVTLSPEVAKKLDMIDERMMDIKRELHQAKSVCLKDLTTKFSD